MRSGRQGLSARDCSYRAKKVAGNGWMMVGDAFGFLDPLYSPGVLLAPKSGGTGGGCDCGRVGSGGYAGRAVGEMGHGIQPGGPDAAAGLRILRRVQF